MRGKSEGLILVSTDLVQYLMDLAPSGWHGIHHGQHGDIQDIHGLVRYEYLRTKRASGGNGVLLQRACRDMHE